MYILNSVVWKAKEWVIFLTGLLAGLALAIALSARPDSIKVETELAVGASEFCCLQDGVWWQSPFGFQGETRSLAWEVGARVRLGNWSLRGAFADLGAASGQNVAVMRDDDFGSFNPAAPCDPDAQRNCLGYFNTSQHVKGVLAGAAYARVIQGVRIEGELGQFLYQSELRVSIWCPDCGIARRYSFGYGGTFSSSSDLRRSNYVSLRLQYGKSFLTWRRFSHINGNGDGLQGIEAQFATGLTSGPVNQLLFGISL